MRTLVEPACVMSSWILTTNFLYSVRIEKKKKKKTELAEISLKAQVPRTWIYFSLRMRELRQGMK